MKINIMVVLLVFTLILVGCTQAITKVDMEEKAEVTLATAPSQPETRDQLACELEISPDLYTTFEGTITKLESGTDGYSVYFESDSKEYATTVSIVSTELWGAFDQLEVGVSITVVGELWNEDSTNIFSKSVHINDGITKVSNVPAIVEAIESTDEGKIITLSLNDGGQMTLITTDATEFPIENLDELTIGSNIKVFGDYDSDENGIHITASTVLIYKPVPFCGTADYFNKEDDVKRPESQEK